MTNDITARRKKTPEEEFKERLLEVGLLTEITPPLPPDAVPKDRRLISIEGKPVSELIIEERR
jgi:hypothetical protein